MTDKHDEQQNASSTFLKIGGALLAGFVLIGACAPEDDEPTAEAPASATEGESKPDKPATPEGQVAQAVRDVLDDAEVTDESRPKKGQWVIEFEAREGFSGVHVDNTKQKMVETVLAIHETGVKVKDVGVRATADLQNSYGEVYEDEQVIWSFWDTGYERVPWDREDIEYAIDPAEAADEYFEHPAVQD